MSAISSSSSSTYLQEPSITQGPLESAIKMLGKEYEVEVVEPQQEAAESQSSTNESSET